jgi:hypothetical protein
MSALATSLRDTWDARASHLSVAFDECNGGPTKKRMLAKLKTTPYADWFCNSQ